MIDVHVELVSEKVNPATIHGWHSSRLVKYDGALYFAANEVRKPDADEEDWWRDHGLIFRRDTAGDGQWRQIAEIEPRVYTSCVDRAGRFWTVGAKDFNYITLWRSGEGMDFDNLARLYDGSCAYLAAGVDRDDNFLLLHAEDTNHTARFPNAVISVYYDAAADSWHPGRMETPEGRYGYMGIILRGRRALALLQSSIYDPRAEPNPPHYNWRLLRLARCDDLTTGQWVQRPWLMRKFGRTRPNDMIVAPDGGIYLAYHHRGGDDSYQATQERPYEYRIARIYEDLSVETFSPGIAPASSRVFIDSRGRWYIMGRADGMLNLWRVDPGNDFKPTDHWELPGTDKLQGGVIHTLRPERFGGEGDGDTVHLVTSGEARVPFDNTVNHLSLWYARFDLPVDE